MKKSTYILLFFLGAAFVQAQIQKSLECSYKIIVQDLTEEELNAIKGENIKTSLINRLNESKKREFILKGNTLNAVFKETERMRSDKDKSPTNHLGSDQYYYDVKSEKVYLFTEFSGTKYLVSNSFSLYNWEITNETKNIDGFKCYKAKGTEIINDSREKKNYTLIAWFCPDLPFKYGPERYFGLPGLIFEAYTENSKEKYVLKSIKFSDEITEIIKPKGKEITEQEFTTIFNKTMNSLYED